MRWLTYIFPRLYDFHLKFLPKKYLRKRNEIISNEIGNNKEVLDLGCGTGLLASYLQKNCVYRGFDTNPYFVRACRKKGLNVKQKDIFLLNNKEYCADIIVICDVLHHTSKYKVLIERALKYAGEKVIISEPIWSEMMKGNSLLSRIRRKMYYFLDNDGNDTNRGEWLTLEEQKKLYSQFKYTKKFLRLGDNLICVFIKK
jgi:SAM-dependent methyltransferase